VSSFGVAVAWIVTGRKPGYRETGSDRRRDRAIRVTTAAAVIGVADVPAYVWLAASPPVVRGYG